MVFYNFFTFVNSHSTLTMKKITLFLLLFLLTTLSGNAQQLVINEILASNTSVNTDEDGTYQDWVELYNASSDPVNLNGFGLSDDPATPYKWVFPAYIIAPGEHKLVWCSDKNRLDPSAPLHTNWKISADGETITLTAPGNVMVDQVAGVALSANVSYGRIPSGGSDFVIFNQPTPGEPNAASGEVSPPEFSVASGFYDEGFELSITHPDPEVSILYTLDGSEPEPDALGGLTYSYKNIYPQYPGDPVGPFLENARHTLVYENPIAITDRTSEPNKISTISTTLDNNPAYLPQFPVFKSTVVRARAIKNGQLSAIATRNYIVTENAASRFSLPVICVNLSEEKFFDYENGIQVAGKDFDEWRAANPDADPYSSQENANFHRSGDPTEMPGHLSLFVNQNEVLSQDIGVRLNGNYTRFFPNKSLRLYARSDYGASTFQYPFFGPGFNSFKRLVLRNGGNDAYGTYFRDALGHRAMNHLNTASQKYRPAIVILNGEYWGMLNIRERLDKHYFERVYGIPDGELDYLEYNGFLVEEGDYEHYASLLNYLEGHSLSDTANYNYVLTQLDPDSFIDHFLTCIYVRNTDWPHNNIEFWRKRTDSFIPNAPYGNDGRWRWVTKDLDFGFGYAGGPESYTHNTLEHASSVGGDPIYNPEWSTFLFRKLLENNNFKNAFINRFADMLNTAFLPERMLGLVQEMKSVIEPEVEEHGQRWASISLESWNNQLAVVNEFVTQRPTYQRQHIQEKFALTGQVSVTLDVNEPPAGFIRMNTVDVKGSTPGVSENPYPWQGIYFKQVPVTVTAIANEGYVFSHWSGSSSSTNATISINPLGNLNLTAHFLPSGINPRIPMYFWMFDTDVANDLPLTELYSTYHVLENPAVLDFESCLAGYPFDSSHPNWRKASMERRNSPTEINYLPMANDGIPFADSSMRGLQVKQPFMSGNQENTMVFSIPTTGYEDLIFRFAAKDEGAAESLVIEYAIDDQDLVWSTQGMSVASGLLSADYKLFEADLSNVAGANDNPQLKVRIRFYGSNMTADNGDRVTFNNFSLEGRPQELNTNPANFSGAVIWPNPTRDYIHVQTSERPFNYEIFSIDGKKVAAGVEEITIQMGDLVPGIYLLRISSKGKETVRKVVKH